MQNNIPPNKSYYIDKETMNQQPLNKIKWKTEIIHLDIKTGEEIYPTENEWVLINKLTSYKINKKNGTRYIIHKWRKINQGRLF